MTYRMFSSNMQSSRFHAAVDKLHWSCAIRLGSPTTGQTEIEVNGSNSAVVRIEFGIVAQRCRATLCGCQRSRSKKRKSYVELAQFQLKGLIFVAN